jgi:hypothetical protein
MHATQCRSHSRKLSWNSAAAASNASCAAARPRRDRAPPATRLRCRMAVEAAARPTPNAARELGTPTGQVGASRQRFEASRSRFEASRGRFEAWVSRAEAWVSRAEAWVSCAEAWVSRAEAWVSRAEAWVSRTEAWVSRTEASKRPTEMARRTRVTAVAAGDCAERAQGTRDHGMALPITTPMPAAPRAFATFGPLDSSITGEAGRPIPTGGAACHS